MGYNLSGVLNAVQLLVDDSIQKAGYDRTVIGTIVECINPETHSYKVKYQDSIFTAVAYNTTKIYERDTAVYVTLPSNDINYTRTIVGKVSQEILDIVDTTKELDRYSSLGTISISDVITLNQDEQNKDIDLSEYFNQDDFEVLKSGFMASPYFVLKSKIFTDIIEENPKGNYGIEITFKFKSAIGREFEKSYVFDVNKMSGQPYNYNGSEQYIIFQVENASLFESIESIKFFSEDFDENYEISFKDIEFYAASKTGEEVNKYSVEIYPRDISAIRDNTDTVVLKADVKIGDEKFDVDSIEYYWFIEDLQVQTTVEGYNTYGWRCLNKSRVITDADGVVRILGYTANENNLTIRYHRNEEGRYEPVNSIERNNKYKCIVKYRENIVSSNEFEVIDYHFDDNEINLSASIVEMFKKANNEYEQDNYDYENGINSTSLRLTDKAKIEVGFNKEEEKEYKYIWQKIYSNENSEFDENSEQYIFGDAIDNYIVYKCAVLDDDKYLGSNRIKLVNIEQSLTDRLVSKTSTFNSLTGNGLYKGIFYVRETKDEETGEVTFKEIEPDQVDYTDSSIQMYLNADYIKAGHLEVSGYDESGVKRTVFYADIDRYQKTQIGGFIVTPYSLFNDGRDIIINEDTEVNNIPLKDIDTIEQGVYLGIDGFFVGDNANYAKIQKKKNNWELKIIGNIEATSGKIGQFNLTKEGLLYSGSGEYYFGIDTSPIQNNQGTEKIVLYLGSDIPSQAPFYVTNRGTASVTGINITGSQVNTPFEGDNYFILSQNSIKEFNLDVRGNFQNDQLIDSFGRVSRKINSERLLLDIVKNPLNKYDYQSDLINFYKIKEIDITTNNTIDINKLEANLKEDDELYFLNYLVNNNNNFHNILFQKLQTDYEIKYYPISPWYDCPDKSVFSFSMGYLYMEQIYGTRFLMHPKEEFIMPFGLSFEIQAKNGYLKNKEQIDYLEYASRFYDLYCSWHVFPPDGFFVDFSNENGVNPFILNLSTEQYNWNIENFIPIQPFALKICMKPQYTHFMNTNEYGRIRLSFSNLKVKRGGTNLYKIEIKFFDTINNRIIRAIFDSEYYPSLISKDIYQEIYYCVLYSPELHESIDITENNTNNVDNRYIIFYSPSVQQDFQNIVIESISIALIKINNSENFGLRLLSYNIENDNYWKEITKLELNLI